MEHSGFLMPFLISLPFCLFALAALSDLRRLVIPNRISLALAGLFPFLFALANPGFAYLTEHLTIGAATLVAGFVLFALGFCGGGDAKLLAAGGLWMDYDAAFYYFTLTGIAGGAVALAVLVSWRAREYLAPLSPAIARIPALDPQKGAPYAVAIGIGALLGFQETALFQASFPSL